MPYVYILECIDGSFYVGSTNDLDTRMEQHGAGRGSRYTACRMPVTLVWAQECDNAYELEKKIQNWSRAKRSALIRGDFKALPGLSRPTRRRRAPDLMGLWPDDDVERS